MVLPAIHPAPHPEAGRTRRVAMGEYEGCLVTILDWYDRIAGRSWRETGHDLRAHRFAFRSAAARLPLDDEVVLARLIENELLFHVEEFDGPQAIGARP